MPVRYIQREYVPRVDLNTLGTAYDTLEKGHQEAVKTASDLKTAIASLDMNAAEDGWKQNKIAEIENEIDANTLYGNSYAALDNLVKKMGDIASDPETIGRLRYQQEYKTFQNSIDANTELTQDAKDYYKAINTYNYQDKYDNNGKIIGGNTFIPISSPKKVIDNTEIMNNALRWAAKESGNGNAVYYLDANGNPTNDINKSLTKEMYMQVGNTWQKLSKDKLRSAVQAAIAATPGARESLLQDYDVAKWKYQTQGIDRGITNKEGRIMTPTEYVNSIFDPFYDAASFYNQATEIKYGNAVTAQQKLIESMGKGSDMNYTGNRADLTVVRSNLINFKNTMPSDAKTSINKNKQIIATILGDDVDISSMTDDEIIQNAVNKNVGQRELVQLYNSIDSIREQQEYLDTIIGTLNEIDADKFNTYNDIISLSPTNKNSEYGQRWQSRVNNIFSGSSAIRQYFPNQDRLESFVNSVGGQDAARDLGIIIGSKDGKLYAELPAKSSNALYSFSKAVVDAVSPGLGAKWRFDTSRVYEDGRESNFFNGGRLDNMSAATSYGGRDFREIIRFVEDLKQTNDKALKGGNLYVSNHAVMAPSTQVAEIIAMRKNNPLEASKYTQVLNDADDEAFRALQSIDMVQTGAYIVDENNALEPMDTEDRKLYTGKLRMAKDSDVTGRCLVQDPQTGKWGVQFNINYKEKKEDKMITVFVPNAGNNIVNSAWNNDSALLAKNDVNVYTAANRPITVASANTFGLDNSIQLVPNGENSYIAVSGDEVLNEVNGQQAAILRDYYYQWRQVANTYAAGGNVNPELLNQIINNVANGLASLHGREDMADYYRAAMLNVIGQSSLR